MTPEAKEYLRRMAEDLEKRERQGNRLATVAGTDGENEMTDKELLELAAIRSMK